MHGQIVILMVTALIENKGKYLVLKRSNKNLTNKRKWQFPEGKVKFGEDLVKALKREVEEETNLVVTNAKLLGIHSTILKEARGAFRMFRTIFRCKVIGKIKLSEEHYEHAWVDRKELDKLYFLEGFDPNNIISVKKIAIAR
jgi:8-oxo-dGTP pyrophosphatase MutT (NUDIX family)